LREILRQDCERLLDAEGLLSAHLAYGRISYDITLRLHLDNALIKESVTTVESRRAARNALNTLGGRDAALEPPPPLAQPGPESAVSAQTLSRTIESPNAERVRTGLPVPVRVRQQDSTVTEELVRYPADAVEGEGDVRVTDDSPAAAKAWGLDKVRGRDALTPRGRMETLPPVPPVPAPEATAPAPASALTSISDAKWGGIYCPARHVNVIVADAPEYPQYWAR